eukprot:3962195-Amphidinium_carterae.1
MLNFTRHLQHVTPIFLNRLKLLQHLHAASWGPPLQLLLNTGRATAISLLQHALPIWYLEGATTLQDKTERLQGLMIAQCLGMPKGA